VAVELVPSSRFSPAELAGLFTASFRGYVVPMEVDEQSFRAMTTLFDFDLDASRVALRDGRPVGLVNLGVRGAAGWIGGTGVVPGERRKGIAEQLMLSVHEAARERGVRDVWLEVIDSNAGAIALYEKLGYEHVRRLEVWRLESAEMGRAGREVPASEAHERVKALRREPEPWQRADEVIEHVFVDTRRGYVAGEAAAVVRVTEQGTIVEQIAAGDVPSARELLTGALEAARPVRLTNVAEDDPVAEAFRELGGSLDIRQHEMRLRL
jgi:GNAT superfamily N-acetyltransferase